MKYICAILLMIIVGAVQAQSVVTCTVTGPAGYSGPLTSSLYASCGDVPPPPPPPPTDCSASQLSTPINGKTFQRQCSGSAVAMPTGTGIGGDLTDLGKVLNGTWPTYNYSGYAPTFTITSGYYVSLVFIPTSSAGIQFTANQSFGDGGTITVSTQPGIMTQGSAGYICGMARGGTNGIYISTMGGVCTVTIGKTYFLNLADTNTSGAYLCYNRPAGSCADSLVSYTFYGG